MPSQFAGMLGAVHGNRLIIFLSFLLWGLFGAPGPAAAAPEPADFLAPYLDAPVSVPAILRPESPTVRQQAPQTPDWKQEWDAARQAVRASRFADAVDIYEHLLTLKGLEEARWELASVYMVLGRYQEAFDLVEILYDGAPARVEFGKAMAYLLLQLGRYKRAGELYVELIALEPENMRLVAGAARSFLEQGRQREALPLLARLSAQDEDNQGLRQKLAFIAYELREDTVAAHHLQQLGEDKAADPEILLRAAKTFDRLKLSREAASYWRRLLDRRPDFLEAHQRLALYHQQAGRVEKALPHLLFLHERQPDDYDLLKRIGQCYVGQQEFAPALEFFERAVSLKPDDKELVRLVVNIHAALGNKQETLEALEHYFRIESHPGEESLKKAASLYDEAGLAEQAIEVYRRLLEVSPDDSDILGALAKNFLEVGKEEEALIVWKKLATIAPDVLPVYRSMVDLLEKLDRRHELLNVLEVIHEREPADQEIALKLAVKFFENGNLAESIVLLSGLADSGHLPAAYYYWRGRLHFRQGEYALAVPAYERYLVDSPQDDEVRLKCLVAAGRLGNLTKVRMHRQWLLAAGLPISADRRWQIAEALYACGATGEARAIFQELIELSSRRFQENEAEPVNDEVTVNSAVRLADIYRELALFYEAEEALRIGFVLTGEPLLLKGLFQLALEQGEHGKAGQWLVELQRVLPPQLTSLRIMEARLLLGLGEKPQAVKLARGLVQELFKKFAPRAGLSDSDPRADKVALAALLLELGEDSDAERLCRSILRQDPARPEPKAMLAKIYWQRGADPLLLPEIQAANLSEQLKLAALFKEQGLYLSMGQLANKVSAELPQSLRARILAAQALEGQGRKASALAAWRALADEHPGNPFLLSELARALFISGELAQALQVSEHLLDQGFRPDIILLQARILWRQNHWDRAIRRYQAVSAPAVASLLEEEATALQFTLPVPELQRSFWEIITGAPGRSFSSALAEQVMAVPSYLGSLSPERRRFNLAAASLYALSRWQQQFEAELLVRQAVNQGEYFLARKQYEALLVSYPAEKILLYDLAGVYSRQGDLGEEAAAYDQLLAEHIDFPELRSAMARNQLKQKPRLVAAAGHQREEGKNDYKDIEKDWQQLSFWYSPEMQQAVAIDLTRINYQSVTRQDVLRSARVFAAYKADIISGLDLSLGAGLESFDSGDANIALFALEATGKLGDKLAGAIRLDRDIVADTAASLSRALVQQKIRGGISFEPLTRLAVGGDYEVSDYSDNNWTTGYDFWSSYVLLSEPTFLQIFYQYDFKESKEGAVTGQLQPDGFAADDHPYWAPKNYWQNEFGLEFTHYLSNESLDRGSPKFYTARYSFGHDSDGYGFQNIAGNFFVEVNPHLLVKATLELSSSPTYRQRHYLLSASYRW